MMNTRALPAHPVSGARALGWRTARPGEETGQLYPVWPILGAADDDGQDDDTDDDGGDGQDDDETDTGGDSGGAGSDDGDTDDGDGDDEGADQLGDKGKQALDRMKAKLKAERARRREAESKLTDGAGTDDAARQAEQAATAKANQRILRSEIRAAAKGKLADPKDALTFLDLDQFEVDDDGQVDEGDIEDAIDELIKNKPYLAAQGGRRFQGSGDGGAQRKAGRPKQLTQQDLKTMTPEQIDQAREAGRLDDLLRGK